jgi:hypothetical protein
LRIHFLAAIDVQLLVGNPPPPPPPALPAVSDAIESTLPPPSLPSNETQQPNVKIESDPADSESFFSISDISSSFARIDDTQGGQKGHWDKIAGFLSEFFLFQKNFFELKVGVFVKLGFWVIKNSWFSGQIFPLLFKFIIFAILDSFRGRLKHIHRSKKYAEKCFSQK